MDEKYSNAYIIIIKDGDKKIDLILYSAYRISLSKDGDSNGLAPRGVFLVNTLYK